MGQVKYARPKGTRDLLPPETERWNAVEQIARDVFRSYGYGEIRTPIFESTELFARSVGASTDIVHKEMYTFTDRGDRSLTLRPENTAGVVRAVIENRLTEGPMPLRLYYIGTQYRYERPQKGRYREFRQIGAELFGAPGPLGDAELIIMLFEFLAKLGFKELSVILNVVPIGQARENFSSALRTYASTYRADFGDDDLRRLEENPLRLFDSKDPKTAEILEGAPKAIRYLDKFAEEDYGVLRTMLNNGGIAVREDHRLVRGLDYYTGTVFEVTSEGLGAQNAILGGGRYDRLVSDLGGSRPIPAVGFSIGQDRLMSLIPVTYELSAPRILFLVVPSNRPNPPGVREIAENNALKIAAGIRKQFSSAIVETDLARRGFEKSLDMGNRILLSQESSIEITNVESSFGEALSDSLKPTHGRFDEIFAILVKDSDVFVVKNLKRHTQIEATLDNLTEVVQKLIEGKT